MRFQRQIFATALAAAAALAHAQEAAKKEPTSGKDCVTFMSSELTNTGLTRLNYRNICTSPFQIRIQAGENLREKAIEPGSPEKPAKAFVTCKPDERCEVAKWRYELGASP
jgi:hypothetical protein